MHQMTLTILLATIFMQSLVSTVVAAENEAGKAAQAEELIDLSSGQDLLLEYRSDNRAFKPYVKRLYSPQGVQVLRDAPHDHIHHHGLMFAIAVNGVDFWAEQPELHPGKQIPQRLKNSAPHSSTKDSSAKGIETIIDWVDEKGTSLMTETRTLEARQASSKESSDGSEPGGAAGGKATLVTWKCILQPAEGHDKVTLSGRPYFGLGIRFVESMDSDGTMSNAAHDKGVDLHDTLKHIRAHWIAYSALADGKRVTVAMFDHPANPRHPATWFAMTNPFAYISATLARDDAPVELLSGSPLKLIYGVAVWDGPIDEQTIQSLFLQWQQGQQGQGE